MDFLPLMLLMSQMTGKQNESGGDLDGMISNLSKVKKMQQMSKSGSPLDMLSGFMDGDNPQMSQALNMIRMMGAMSNGFGKSRENGDPPPQQQPFEQERASMTPPAFAAEDVAPVFQPTGKPGEDKFRCTNHKITYCANRHIYR